jgi:hypothetical protein
VRVDPQVLSDVVEFTFPLPDSASQSRARRIENFTNNLYSRECGVTTVPLDYVRRSPGVDNPDLDFIREHGLAPLYDPMEYYGLKEEPGSGMSAECARVEKLCAEAGKKANETDQDPDVFLNSKEKRECDAEQKRVHPVTFSPDYVDAMENAMKAGIVWEDETRLTVFNTEAVLAEAKPMAQCLRDGSGLNVSDDDPSRSFGISADVAYFRMKDPVGEDEMWEWSRLYVDCAEPYFTAMKRELEARRPALVERHREALEAFAIKLMEVGYVP